LRKPCPGGLTGALISLKLKRCFESVWRFLGPNTNRLLVSIVSRWSIGSSAPLLAPLSLPRWGRFARACRALLVCALRGILAAIGLPLDQTYNLAYDLLTRPASI